MLTTLIYQSKKKLIHSDAIKHEFVENLRIKNQIAKISSVLLYNGDDFFQIIEGKESTVDSLYKKICKDEMHTEVVELMRDYASTRYFTNYGVEFYDLRQFEVSNDTRNLMVMNLWSRISPNKRVYQFIRAFILKGRSNILSPDFSDFNWSMTSDISRNTSVDSDSELKKNYSFAFQAIVEPMERKVHSFESLIRGKDGCSPEVLFSSLDYDEIHEFDLRCKSEAIRLASSLLKEDETVSINLLPDSLTTVNNSVDILLHYIEKNDLKPQQIIIEVIESELIKNIDMFHHIIKDIRAAGLGFAIDDFGSGYSRLGLLARIQPDKLKLDRELIQDIHLYGPKQAMVASLIKYSSDMGISLIAEGVEKIDEWRWLQSAGIHYFQGFLFSRPCINGVSEIFWPHRI
ncbi:diguanylate phosphodiesterase (plasmid) [Kosakonia cowanii]|uniref:diguanylate phosphodiesterase n=1 Tax=Kosakonia cowanii TaxID=208223 RepID=UPI001E60E702|nr:diguanylate phosphodiesterase [Kosakonia cowanii]UGS48540.1 diguanylate phosphodiesterase [Kosakonia cowanii]